MKLIAQLIACSRCGIDVEMTPARWDRLWGDAVFCPPCERYMGAMWRLDTVLSVIRNGPAEARQALGNYKLRRHDAYRFLIVQGDLHVFRGTRDYKSRYFYFDYGNAKKARAMQAHLIASLIDGAYRGLRLMFPPADIPGVIWVID